MANVEKPRLMSHEDRQALIRQPITFNTFGLSRQWAGMSFNPESRYRPRAADNLPDNGYFSENWE